MRLLCACLFVAVMGCTSEGESEAPSTDCLPPNRMVADRCLEPGVQDDGCPAGTLGLEDGSCQPAGVPPELCGEGFEPDGRMGCAAILPSERCPAGQMAVPGESVCRVVMTCGAGKWGDIPVDDTTVYVDGSYAGLDSIGSTAKPFTTISDAVAAAASGALIAVAAGVYVEDVDLENKTLRLWGKCPGEVELHGTGASLGALVVGGSGTEIHGLALGGWIGLAIMGAEGVLIDRVWVHHASGPGVIVDSSLGPTSVTMRDSLVEENHDLGVLVGAADATLERVVVRRTLPRASDQLVGWGIAFQAGCLVVGCDLTGRSTALVRGSLVEDNHDVGLTVSGSDATLEGLVVRGTLPRAADQIAGWGTVIQVACSAAGCNSAAPSTGLLRSSLIEGNHDMGVSIMSSDAKLEGVTVRGTLPQASNQRGGRGINVQDCTGAGCDSVMRATALVRASLVEDNHELGVLVSGSDATLEGLLVRRTWPEAYGQLFGRGISIQLSCDSEFDCDPTTRSIALVRGSLVEANHDLGVFVGSSEATLEGLLVRGTLARQGDQLFGDGVDVASYPSFASAIVTSTRIEANARAGLSNFGATVALGASALSCNRVDLNGEVFAEQPFTFEDLGDNACGCPDPVGACKAQSVGLEPPQAISGTAQ